MAGRSMAMILSGVHLGTENLHFEWKVNGLASSGKSRGKGSSKKQKVAELPPSGEALVLDMLVGLLDEVKWLQEEVKQQGEWIFSTFEVLS